MNKTIEIDGMAVAYNVTGDGPRPVIVMHGWGCTSATVALLADACCDASTTVYNLDLPGFGLSTEPSTVWGVGEYTTLVEKFARRLGIEQPVLVGHSFGGRLAIVYASRNDVDKMILVDAAGIKPRRSFKYYFKVYSYKLAKRMAPLLLGRERGQALIDKMRGKAGSSDYNNATPRMRAIMSRVVNEDLTHLLPQIKASTLLIWGTADTATPISDAQKMERLIPDAGLVAYEGAGHYSFLERPAQTKAVIASFLNFKR